MLDGYDAVLFDLDGVLRLGDTPVPGAARVVEAVQADRRVRVLTNDSRSTRAEIGEALSALGIDVDPADVLTSGWATARALRDHPADTAFVIGGAGLRTELDAVGVTPVGAGEDADAVVVGLDETVTYDDLTAAARLIHGGAAFVATNVDRRYPTPAGIAPSTGAIVRAVEHATATPPTVVGKPEPRMFDLAVGDADPADAVVVGDNPESDVVGAHRAGMDAVLYAPEGATVESDADAATPEAVVTDLTDLLGE